ncbi:MAG: hypothetical protein Q4F55_03640, partial [Bacillota bacterium]|nr:hypothetical protein [Bacillota bacterium]
DSDFGFKEFEKEFNQQFKETAKSPAAFEKVFTKEEEAERKRAIKDAVRKEKEKLRAAKTAARKTPEFIRQIREKYYGFIDKIQRRIDEIEGERIEAETQRYIVSKYKKAEKARLAAEKKEAKRSEVQKPEIKKVEVKKPEKVKAPAKAKAKETQHVDYLKLAKNRFSNAYYTWAVVWDQLDEERELRKIDKLSKQHNKEFLQ